MFKDIQKSRQTVKPVLTLMVIGVLAIGANPVHASRSATLNRPISDFVSQQGKFCLDDGMGGCLLFVPPVPNFAGWADVTVSKFVLVDYAGVVNAFYGGVFGTQTTGTVVERPLRDGRAEVTVNLDTSNALTWVAVCCDFANGTLLFGHRAPEVLAGLDAALGESFFHISFTNTAPGAPLPDLIQLFIQPAPGQEVNNFVFHANVNGTLRSAFGVPDGTPGKVTVAQTGNPTVRSNIQASVINVRQTGK